jgi:glyoxylase-like metal-dependent hydrolase (beta-lactamase superfamily II)
MKVDVSSYAIDDGERLLLFDPLAVPSEIVELAAERETAIVLTSPWHRRDAVALSEQLKATIYVPPPDPPDPDPVPGQVYRAGDRLPIGDEAFPGREEPHDLVLWIESHRALVAGDTLVDRGRGLEFLPEWAPEGVTPDETLEALQPLRDLPVALVLPTHGPPTDRAALKRALDGQG